MLLKSVEYFSKFRHLDKITTRPPHYVLILYNSYKKLVEFGLIILNGSKFTTEKSYRCIRVDVNVTGEHTSGCCGNESAVGKVKYAE